MRLLSDDGFNWVYGEVLGLCGKQLPEFTDPLFTALVTRIQRQDDEYDFFVPAQLIGRRDGRWIRVEDDLFWTRYPTSTAMAGI